MRVNDSGTAARNLAWPATMMLDFPYALNSTVGRLLPEAPGSAEASLSSHFEPPRGASSGAICDRELLAAKHKLLLECVRKPSKTGTAGLASGPIPPNAWMAKARA